MKASKAANFALAISLLAISISVFVWKDTRPTVQSSTKELQSYFQAPENLEQLINDAKQSLVTVECGDWIGSGWVTSVDWSGLSDPSEIALVSEFPSAVITNHHVVEDCIDDRFLARRVLLGATQLRTDFTIWNWDKENDLALIVVKAKLKPLVEATEYPEGGWWSMAIGSPWENNSSISIGNVISRAKEETNFDIITTSVLNPGNSGGPLINSRGEVMGTNTWRINDVEQGLHNIAVENDAICELLLDCS